MHASPAQDQAPGRSLTGEQRLPLEVPGASVALGAGAGCGKTTVLTERFLAEVGRLDGRPLRSIVVLTFTQKAARELRGRIRAECRARLDGAAGADSPRWRATLRALEAAPIGTFHEFCTGVLRRHAVAAAIDPEFVVLDASIADSLRDEALARCVRQHLAERDGDLIELAVDFGLNNVRQALRELVPIRASGDLAGWAELTAAKVVESWQAIWEGEGRAALLHRVAQAARPTLGLLAANECSHNVMQERRRFLLEQLPDLERCPEPAALLAEIKENAKVQGGGTRDHWPSPEIYEAIKKQFEALRKEIKTFEDSARWCEATTLAAAEHGLRFARLALHARRAYDAAKRARGGLDFDDLLIRTRDLLRDRADAVSGGPAGPVDLVLVDEFQDTDPVQAEILESLGGDRLCDGLVFLVGDFKQSIYRFRGARPQLFQQFRGRFPEAGRLDLTENFRSVPGILDFVNALFEGAFPGAEARLQPGKQREGVGPGPAVEFVWAVEPGGSAGARASAAESRQVEAGWLARLLRQRLAAGWPVRDRATDEVRNAHPGDVAFLFRAMTDVAPYESALAAEGLEYHVIGGSAFYSQQEVNDLVNVLSVVEDPCDSVALAGALRSPFFCVSDAGLFWLATHQHGDRPAELCDGLDRCDRVAELSPLDRRRAARARDLLARWRGLKDRVPTAALVALILDESGYEAALPGEFLGPRKRANARKFVRLARRFDEQGGFTLADFVARLRADLREPPKEEQAVTNDEEGECVRLMSIHQAKGLEFPIVVVPDLNRKVDVGRKSVALHAELGLVVRPPSGGVGDEAAGDGEGDGSGESAERDGPGTSLGWMIYQALERREEYDEALRLFYVATTRARDVLILSAGLGPDAKPVSPALKLLDERFDRRTGQCRPELPDGWGAPLVRVTQTCPAPEPGHVRVRRRRPALLAIARAIERTPQRLEPDAPRPPRRPAFVDLDPALALGPTAARLDRLVRAILADRRAFRPQSLAAVAAEAAQGQDPAAHAGTIAEAIDRLTPWWTGRIGAQVAAAAERRHALPWTTAWPPDRPDATVFQGAIDLACRDRRGDWLIVNVSDVRAPDARERLRLLLSAHAAAASGLGPVRQAWRIRLGPGGGLRGEEQFDAHAITAAVDEFLATTPRN